MTASSNEKRRFTGFRIGLWSSGFVCLGLLLLWASRLYEHHRAVRHVESLGGCVRYHYQYGDEHNPEGNFDSSAVDTNRVRRWFSDRFGDSWFHDVRHVDLTDTATSDADLQRLTVFTRLRRLELSDTRVTGAGLTAVRDLNHLHYVGLSGTPLTTEGLRTLTQNRSIRRLNIYDIEPRQELLEVVLQFEHLEFIEWDIEWEERRHAERIRQRFPGILVYSP